MACNVVYRSRLFESRVAPVVRRDVIALRAAEQRRRWNAVGVGPCLGDDVRHAARLPLGDGTSV
jgi:hypothetical protein